MKIFINREVFIIDINFFFFIKQTHGSMICIERIECMEGINEVFIQEDNVY